jgi:2-keto-4-pentenoate hydratase/2-oxohepta-3-ene-1,7-dioic acid hydratase in catechol pathway
MKLARFNRGGAAEIGVIAGEDVLPLEQLALSSASMIELIEGWSGFRDRIARLADATTQRLPLSSVTLLAPIARPGKILCMGLNYRDHVEEAGLAMPKHQVWFCKHSNTVNDPYASIELPKVSDLIDYEVELVVVIGKAGRHIAFDDARNHVFGYCVGNDVSVRDWQTATPQWMLGKSFDTHGPFGPWITTADEIGDPHRLGIKAIVNGVVRQNSNVKHLIFTVWHMIEHLSTAMTLEAGDIIFTGTPGGVGYLSKPPALLRHGDVVRCEIEELGAIENICVSEA